MRHRAKGKQALGEYLKGISRTKEYVEPHPIITNQNVASLSTHVSYFILSSFPYAWLFRILVLIHMLFARRWWRPLCITRWRRRCLLEPLFLFLPDLMAQSPTNQLGWTMKRTTLSWRMEKPPCQRTTAKSWETSGRRHVPPVMPRLPKFCQHG